MIYLIHGENMVTSRNRVQALNAVEITDKQDQPQEDSLFSVNNYVIWKDHKLSVTQINALKKKYPDIIVEEFKLDQTVFKFVDSLSPGNQAQIMPLWKTYLSQEIPEIAFIMIVRQIRLMLDHQGPDIAPWQKKKIEIQANKFGKIRLESIYKSLLEIDYLVKTGQIPINLTTSLELVLLTL